MFLTIFCSPFFIAHIFTLKVSQTALKNSIKMLIIVYHNSLSNSNWSENDVLKISEWGYVKSGKSLLILKYLYRN